MKVAIAPSLTYMRDHKVCKGGIVRIVDALYRYLPEYGIELTENESEADVLHSIASGEWTRPTVYTSQGVYPEPCELEWQTKMNDVIRGQLRAAKIVTAPSKYCASLCASERKDVDVIYNGVDWDEWQGKAENGGYVLWAKCSLVTSGVREGWRIAAETALRVSEREFVFTLWDDKVLKPSNVTVIGAKPYDDIKKWIKGAMVYLVTTREPAGIQTIEAMASGVPVAGCPIGANPEYVRNGTDGVLSSNVSESIRMTISNWKWFSTNARERARKFDWKNIVPKYAEAYRKA